MSQSSSATCSSASQHLTAVSSSHSLSEAVDLFPLELLGLICSLHFIFTLLVTRPSISPLYPYQDTPAKKFGKKDHGDYEGYRDLIDKIRDASEKRTGYHISREDFDHLLWYYFKGHPEEVTKALDLMKAEAVKE